MTLTLTLTRHVPLHDVLDGLSRPAHVQRHLARARVVLQHRALPDGR